MEMLPPAPSVGEVPDDDETASTTALIAQVPRIALEELARRMLENPGSARNANGHGRRSQKRRRDEPTATPSPGTRRQRRVVNYAEDPDFEP